MMDDRTNAFMAAWRFDRFDAVEIDPVYDDTFGVVERVTRDDVWSYWSVFGHLREGGCESLLDCADEDSARLAGELLKMAIEMASSSLPEAS